MSNILRSPGIFRCVV